MKHCRCEHMVHVCLQQKQNSGKINEEGVNLKLEIAVWHLSQMSGRFKANNVWQGTRTKISQVIHFYVWCPHLRCLINHSLCFLLIIQYFITCFGTWLVSFYFGHVWHQTSMNSSLSSTIFYRSLPSICASFSGVLYQHVMK